MQRSDDVGVLYDALPGLSKVVNTTTLTSNEKAFFLAIAPEPLKDEHILERAAAMVTRGASQMIKSFVHEPFSSPQEDDKRDQSVTHTSTTVSTRSPQPADANELIDVNYHLLSTPNWEDYRIDLENDLARETESVDDRWAIALAIEDYVHLHML